MYIDFENNGHVISLNQLIDNNGKLTSKDTVLSTLSKKFILMKEKDMIMRYMPKNQKILLIL